MDLEIQRPLSVAVFSDRSADKQLMFWDGCRILRGLLQVIVHLNVISKQKGKYYNGSEKDLL